MTIIYSLNNLVNGTQKSLCELKHKFYVYQNSNFIFIKTSIISLSKIKFYFIKNQLISLIKYQILSLSKNQILSLSKIKIYLYQKSNFIFINFLFDFCH